MKNKYMKPEVEMRLYGIVADGLNYDFFDNIDDLLHFCRKNIISARGLTVLDYIRDFAGKKDVIRIQTSDISNMYSVINDKEVAIFNDKKSEQHNKYVWDFEIKNLQEFYNEFRNRGISFEDDIYSHDKVLTR